MMIKKNLLKNPPNNLKKTISFIVKKKDAGKRLDTFLTQKKKLSRNFIQKEIKKNHILVNNLSQKASYVVKEDDEFVCFFSKKENSQKFKPENINLDIVYEDDNILIINKQANFVVHPANGHSSGTLLNALLHYYPAIEKAGGITRCGIVHRLDKDTTGLMLVAKDKNSFETLSNDFKNRKIEKKYLALVYGKPKEETGKIEIEIGRDKKNRKKISPNSNKLRYAKTEFELLKYFEKSDISLLELNLKTGRTHQIRVHLKAVNLPIVGDKLYGKKKEKIKAKRQMLHSFKILFTHPKTGKKISLEITPPEDFNYLRALHN